MKRDAVLFQKNRQTESKAQRCARCHGYLVEVYMDRADTSEFSAFHSPILMFRCVNCGEYLDSKILWRRYMMRKKEE